MEQITNQITEADILGTRTKVAKTMQQRRKSLNMSVEKLARMTGMSSVTIRRFESGNNWINFKQYLLIYEATKPIKIQPGQPKEETTE